MSVWHTEINANLPFAAKRFHSFRVSVSSTVHACYVEKLNGNTNKFNQQVNQIFLRQVKFDVSIQFRFFKFQACRSGDSAEVCYAKEQPRISSVCQLHSI